MNDYVEKEKKYLAQCYKRFNICIKYGEGTKVYDINEKEYIDFTSGIGVNSMGYCKEEWLRAVSEQIRSLSHISNLYYTLPMLELAEKLCQRLQMRKVFFSNSGAESNEAAIKIARKYSDTRYKGKRNKIVTLYNSFHGRTLATLAATGQDVFHRFFHPFPEGFCYIEDKDISSFDSLIEEDTAAVMIELIQGEGGVIPLSKGFVSGLSEFCKKNDILLIVDEVQTGIGRCGSLCAFEQYGIKPDLVTLAKGLGGGLPIGAVMIGETCEDVLEYGDHGSTFGANPVCCSGANAVLDLLDEAMLKDIRSKSKYLFKRLSDMKHVKSVRGMGLMLGVEFENGIDSRKVVEACIKEGVLFLTAKDRLRLLPPLTISVEEIDRGMAVLEKILFSLEVKK